MKKTAIFTVILTLLFSMNFISCGSDSEKPSKVVLKSFELMKNKEYDKVAALYISGDNKMLSEDEAKKLEGMIGMGAKEYEKEGGIDKIVIDKETINEDGTKASVDFTIHFKNGKTDETDADLVKVEGKWYMKIITH